VEYLNENAESKRIEAVGWHARILPHEIDLAGVL
jgi:peptide deformylase